jgi:tetratricopeptide (TPR) repeat protein
MPLAGKSESLVLVFVALAGLFAFTDSAARAYRGERLRRANAHFANAQQLAREGQTEQAVEEYRAALSYSPSNSRYELALALALMDLNRLSEAESHLLQLRESDPDNALIDLQLARISAREGKIPDAVMEYHRAIYGLWPNDAERNRLQARFELLDLLTRTGQSRTVLAELLVLADEAPANVDVQMRVANLLLRHGVPERARELFAGVLAKEPHNLEAVLGQADAAFAEGDYSAADAGFSRALRLNPGNADARQRLGETAEIRSLDPTLVSLSANERYERSRKLVDKTLESLESCAEGKVLPAGAQDVLSMAREFLLRERRHREGDTPKAISLAEQVWTARKQACGLPPASEDALDLVMTKVTK